MTTDRKAQLTGREVAMNPDEIIVTKTDLSGKITYGNRTFFKFAGYSEKDCLGTQHNIVRHPEMPRCVFDIAWDTIKSGQEIFAYVNNRSRNGDNYWVLAHMTPSRDGAGNIIGYHSNRRAPEPRIVKDIIVPLYRELLDVERSSVSPKDGMSKARKHVQSILAGEKMTFNQFTLSLGA